MRSRKKLIKPDTAVLLKQIGIGLTVFFVVALLFSGVWYGTRVEALTINTVKISGGKTINHVEVKSKVDEVLAGQYLGLVPKRFAWTYPKEELEHAVASLERIKDITVQKISSQELQVTFDEYIPQSLWCQSIELQECVFLDEAGYAFGRAPKLSGGSFLRLVKTGESPMIETNVLDSAWLTSVQKMVRKIENYGWSVTYVEIDQMGDFFISIVGGGEVKVTVDDDSDVVFDSLLLILLSEEFSHLAPGNFQYIDLRFGNKVFVNEEEKNASSSVKSDV